jgi:glycosyltransferase involved in cell wall biosynthesis/SAM-dependent methyltransferase
MAESPEAVHRQDFWRNENMKYAEPHHRMLKVSRIVNELAEGGEKRLLDIGCGPATLATLLEPNIRYYGMDVALQKRSPNLSECDILEERITSEHAPFDLVVAQGIFEYLADRQEQKLAEIADLLSTGGRFIVSYVNFGHRRPYRYWLYTNVQPIEQFRDSLSEYFVVEKQFPTAHNWSGSEPTRWYVRRPNMHVNLNVPFLTKKLSVEYIFVCRLMRDVPRAHKSRRIRRTPSSALQSKAVPLIRPLNASPKVSIGLPVYNGEQFLSEAMHSLLGQTFGDFELLVADNASTDGTEEICREFASSDSRVTYVRHDRNIGLIPNHVFVMEQATGELFKCAAHDDLYGRDLLARCVEILDEDEDAVLAHSWSAVIDADAHVTGTFGMATDLDSPKAATRFRSMLFEGGHDLEYGVIRTRALRMMNRQASYLHQERTYNAGLALSGRIRLVPQWLYFRREHLDAVPLSVRDRCVIFDPRRANRLRHPTARLYGEYAWGYVSAIRRAPLAPADRHECYGILAHWMASRVVPVAQRSLRREPLRDDPMMSAPFISVDDLVAGRPLTPVSRARRDESIQ